MTMTASEYAARRVAAAQDVLERIIPDEDFEITTGCYLGVDYMTSEPCKACAAGALTLAVIAPHVLGNQLLLEDVTLAESMKLRMKSGSSLDADDLREPLLELVDLDQLALIEAAFMHGFIGDFADRRFITVGGESRYAVTIYDFYDPEDVLDDEDLVFYQQLEAAVEFGLPYGDDRERLGAIMENIVKNGGTFVPAN